MQLSKIHTRRSSDLLFIVRGHRYDRIPQPLQALYRLPKVFHDVPGAVIAKESCSRFTRNTKERQLQLSRRLNVPYGVADRNDSLKFPTLIPRRCSVNRSLDDRFTGGAILRKRRGKVGQWKT